MKIVYYVSGAIIVLWLIRVIGLLQRKKRNNIHIAKEQCKGCGKCLKACHHKVLEIKDAQSGKYAVLKNPENCTFCGDCIKVCKFKAIEYFDKGEK